MADRTRNPITEAHCESYLSNQSSFSFELQTLETLNALGFACQHSGTYHDPVTGKPREFDIRAAITNRIRLSLAIECKHLTSANPLLAHCIPRAADESFFELIECAYVPDGSAGTRRYSDVIFRRKSRGLYSPGNAVCKSLANIWEEKAGNNCFVTGRDNEVYDKWSQAISSCHDLIREETRFQYDVNRGSVGQPSFILPILVIPDGTLYKVDFESDGKKNGTPKGVDHISMFIGITLQPWDKVVDSPYALRSYTLSHLEVVTLGALPQLVQNINLSVK